MSLNSHVANETTHFSLSLKINFPSKRKGGGRIYGQQSHPANALESENRKLALAHEGHGGPAGRVTRLGESPRSQTPLWRWSQITGAGGGARGFHGDAPTQTFDLRRAEWPGPYEALAARPRDVLLYLILGLPLVPSSDGRDRHEPRFPERPLPATLLLLKRSSAPSGTRSP